MANFFGNLMKGSDVTAVKKKRFTEGTLRYNLHLRAQLTLGDGVKSKQAVKKPDSETFNDWLAVHVVDFFNRCQILYYGTIREVCTDTTCPIMSGGGKYDYLWQDGVQFKVRKI